jgi:hypothetical protein
MVASAHPRSTTAVVPAEPVPAEAAVAIAAYAVEEPCSAIGSRPWASKASSRALDASCVQVSVTARAPDAWRGRLR